MMSKTKIPPLTVLKLWARSGGRCEFKGCNEPLWRDDLTYTDLNRAHIAHIVADSPDGPRGHKDLSPKLATDFDNLMLLCTVHHKLVDDYPEVYTVDLLRTYKKEHEDRIELVTSSTESLRTHLLVFKGPINGQPPVISFEEIKQAVVPRYPAHAGAIEIDLTSYFMDDGEDGYFRFMQDQITRQVQHWVHSRVDLDKITHLSVFALASIPLLIHFGRELGYVVPTDVYEYHRETGSWSWEKPGTKNMDYRVHVSTIAEPSDRIVAINLSLSGVIHEDEIRAALGDTACRIYTMTMDNPVPGFLYSKDQLDAFARKMRDLLAAVRRQHGPSCEVHLFPAVPASVAVRLGQLLLPKVDPPLHVYDKRKHGGFRYAL